MEMLRLVRRSSRSRSARVSRLEPLEHRRLLSTAPVAVDDAYELGADHRLSVGDPASTVPAFDETRWPVPTGPFTEPDVVLVVEGGRVVTHPDWVMIGASANSFGAVTVRDPGSRWIVTNWMDMGNRGKGTLTVTDGGRVVVNNFIDTADHGIAEIVVSNGGSIDARNWTAIGEAETGSTGGGSGSLTITGPTSRWTSHNWFEVGYGRSRGSLRLLDGARLSAVGEQGGQAWVGVGTNGGFGTMEISGGSVFTADGWASMGTGGGSTQGDGLAVIDVRGAGSAWRVDNFMTIGDGGGRAILNISDGGTVSAGNWVDIGQNARSDGRVLVGSGSTFTYTDRLTLGDGFTGPSRGTLYVAEGGTVIGRTRPFMQTPGINNNAGGRILGSGSVQGHVTNNGFISPGGSTGVLTINGSLVQPSANGGIVQFDIGGTQRGSQYDGLDVSGAAQFAGGSVVLNFINGFAPRQGDRFDLVDFGTTGTVPQNVEVRGLAPGFEYTLGVVDGRLVMTAANDATSAPVTVQRIGVLANDTDADGDALTAVLARRPEHGTLNLYRNGSFSYVPGPTFAGTDSFQYVADDGLFTSAPATVTIRNLAPTARDDAYATDENTPLAVPVADGVLRNDNDSVSTSLMAQLVDGPDHGTLALNPDGSFTYTPAANFNGTDTFTYRASDGSVVSTPATVTITVRPGNSNPVAVADARTVRQGHDLRFDARELLANDTDPDGDSLTVTGVAATADTHGTVSLSRGRITYRPDRRYTGPASFTYTISDGHGGTAIGTVNVTVLPKHRGNRGSAFGAGSLGGGRRQFAFAVSGRGSGEDFAIGGTVTYRDIARKLAVRAGDIDLFEISSDANTVTIAGAASVNGRDGYRFELTAEDRSRSGRDDRIRIRVTGPGQFSYDSGGSDRIERGNVIIMRSGHDDNDDDD